MLNDSLYRLKKEKEENETQQSDYIQTLEKRDKERVVQITQIEKDLKREK